MKRINITIEQDEHEKAKEKAKKSDMTLSQLIRKLLREFAPVAE